jgi:hypothetical protein
VLSTYKKIQHRDLIIKYPAFSVATKDRCVFLSNCQIVVKFCHIPTTILTVIQPYHKGYYKKCCFYNSKAAICILTKRKNERQEGTTMSQIVFPLLSVQSFNDIFLELSPFAADGLWVAIPRELAGGYQCCEGTYYHQV